MATLTETATERPVVTFDDIHKHFPGEARPQQIEGLELIAESLSDGTPALLNAPTGSGKSFLGFAAASWAADNSMTGSHYVTSQNILTTQLMDDFSQNGLVVIKGKSNYRCHSFPTNCGDVSVVGSGCAGCVYRQAKDTYAKGKLGTTNYSYLLAEAMYSGQFPPRDTLILDEAHNIEREILDVITISLTPLRCEDLGVTRLPFFPVGSDTQVRQWLSKVLLPKLDAEILSLNIAIENDRHNNVRPSADAQKRVAILEPLQRNINLFMEGDASKWFVWSDERSGILNIKPLMAAEYAQKYLFRGANNLLFMSATILDFKTFCRGLGIKKAHTLSLPSDFPIENRRIVYWPVGSMSKKSIEKTLPRAAERTLALLNKYKAKKTILHTHTYAIRDYIMNYLMGTEHYDDMITHTTAPGDRERAYVDHCTRLDAPTNLITPSMVEGVNLKDDLARLSIIYKVPYPYLDPYNTARKERDPAWYQLQTAVPLVQATGRHVRSATDHGLTVILDSDFGDRFLSQNQGILDKWWLDSIEFR